MAENSFSCKIKGENATIYIDDDPAWGKMRNVFTKCYIPDGKGTLTFQPMSFFDEILPAVIIKIEGVQFDHRSKALWLELPGSEITAILGEIIERLPLETYSKNLKLDGSLILSQIQ